MSPSVMMMMIKSLPQLNDLALDKKNLVLSISLAYTSLSPSAATGNSCMPNGSNFKRNKTIDM